MRAWIAACAVVAAVLAAAAIPRPTAGAPSQRAHHRARTQSSRRRSRARYSSADNLHARTLDAGVRVVTFKACSARRAGSDAGGRKVTFWSGFILASAPACLRVKAWIDGARTPRRARIPIGRRC